MKLKWLENDIVGIKEDGCYLDEPETDLLIRLAGRLSRDFLYSKGFSSDEVCIIQKWMHAL